MYSKAIVYSDRNETASIAAGREKAIYDTGQYLVIDAQLPINNALRRRKRSCANHKFHHAGWITNVCTIDRSSRLLMGARKKYYTG